MPNGQVWESGEKQKKSFGNNSPTPTPTFFSLTPGFLARIIQVPRLNLDQKEKVKASIKSKNFLLCNIHEGSYDSRLIDRKIGYILKHYKESFVFILMNYIINKIRFWDCWHNCDCLFMLLKYWIFFCEILYTKLA